MKTQITIPEFTSSLEPEIAAVYDVAVKNLKLNPRGELREFLRLATANDHDAETLAALESEYLSRHLRSDAETMTAVRRLVARAWDLYPAGITISY